MKVFLRFPLDSGGPLGRAREVAAGHPGCRIEGERVGVELDLPADWRTLHELSVLLRGEGRVEYAVDGRAVRGEELFAGMRCFFRKERSGSPAREWCTPRSLSERQLFPCRQIHVYDNPRRTPNSWYSFGRMGEDGVFRVDKEAMAARVVSDLGAYAHCPILDLDGIAETMARLPDEIDPSREAGWSYREDGPLSEWGVTRSGEREEEPEEGESLFERLAKSVRSRGAGVAAAGGDAPGSRSIPATRYEDVGGLDETVALVREAVELPMTHPEIFRRLGIRPHRGIIFHGPPGTGKTLLARAVAHECGAHFIAVSGPEILSRFWGQSEAKLRAIFAEARAKAPSIILFDEIDSFASAREAMSESFEATLVSQLLSLMDGLGEPGRVCVIATTNRLDAIDPALRRPGRFDHEIEVGLPDEAGRRRIFEIHTRRMPTDPTLDLDELARLTRGYSGADIEALCREAALACMRRTIDLRSLERRIPPHRLDSLRVTTYDFRTAMKRVRPSVGR